jgi:diguanylate cyclase (GGDEF)-like protein
MLEVDSAIYIYAWYSLLFTAIFAFIYVVRSSLNNVLLSDSLVKLYTLYFVSGALGFMGVAAKDAMLINMGLTLPIIFYIACTYVLFLATTEDDLTNQLKMKVGIANAILIVGSIYLENTAAQLLFLSIYSFFAYTPILFLTLRRGTVTGNRGYYLISVAVLGVLLCVPIEVFSIIALQDDGLAYGIKLIASATGFVLVGIGFLTLMIMKENEQLNLLVKQDPLTGMLNRRAIDLPLDNLIDNSASSQGHTSAIAIDIDDFKSINDRYGHDAGDKILKTFSNSIQINARGTDTCVRLGGDEFIIILPNTERDIAVTIAERIRKSIEAVEIYFNEEPVNITSSIGVSTHSGEVDISSLMKSADQALYAAKQRGKNNVFVELQEDSI